MTSQVVEREEPDKTEKEREGPAKTLRDAWP
jgi:hypothetical protein